jgi:hypothetical protein
MVCFQSCSKKAVPEKEKVPPLTSVVTYKHPKKIIVLKKRHITPTPNQIFVEEKAAKKTADGRHYYDLEGNRYWRNKKDGMYYLYYKGMFEDSNFQ